MTLTLCERSQDIVMILARRYGLKTLGAAATAILKAGPIDPKTVLPTYRPKGTRVHIRVDPTVALVVHAVQQEWCCTQTAAIRGLLIASWAKYERLFPKVPKTPL